jgi:hypothetical protein
MTIAISTDQALRAYADAVYSATGVIGYIALLKNGLTTNTVTANAATEVLTTAANHGLVTGIRFRLSAAVTAPAPLVTTVDYYAIVVGPTALKAAATLADAIAGVAINLNDAGLGTITLLEQELNPSDPLSVLINKELSHPAWTSRGVIGSTGAASTPSTGVAEKTPPGATITNTSATPLIYKHALLLFGGTSVIGSINGVTSTQMATETIPQVVAQGETKVLALKLRVRAA